MFRIDREQLQNDRVTYIDDVVPIQENLADIEFFINRCFVEEGIDVVQHGRVIALRATDKKRLSSAFKAAVYLGKYKDMDNVSRFLKKMVSAGHSYEPIRGENILFLYIGVGKPVYDHLVTYTVGRPTRIAAGQRANLPWGYEVPAEAKEGVAEALSFKGVQQVRDVVNLTKGLDEDINKQQIQIARSLLPVGYVMPPFLMEFTEEALIKAVLKQRIFEKGAQGATVDVVLDMYRCCLELDREKWEHLYDYHGGHIDNWNKAMRTLRDKGTTLGELVDLAHEEGLAPLVPLNDDTEFGAVDFTDVNVYELLMKTVGKLPPSMWEKQK